MSRLIPRVNQVATLYCVLAFLVLAWPLSSLLLVIVVFGRLTRQRRQRLTTLGSARWANAGDLRRAGLLGATSGLILGRLPNHRGWFDGLSVSLRNDALVRLATATHVAIFGPTSAGKGVSFVVPTLLTDPRPMVVHDPKGELARLTARHREKMFGHRSVLVDPFRCVTQTPDTYNPLDPILKDDRLAPDDCLDLGDSVVVRPADEKDPHWSQSAIAVIAAVCGTVVQYGEPGTRSLQTVRDIISHPAKLDTCVKLMTESTCWGGSLASMGGHLMHFDGKEKASVITSALRHLQFLGTPVVSESVRTSSFDPNDLRNGRLTVFLILPPDRAAAQAGLLRLWVGSMLRACYRGGLQ